jgi:hypothetical protein
LSWIFIFLLVFFSGGEVPTPIQEEEESNPSLSLEQDFDLGLTSSQFEIERQTAIVGSSGADASFMKDLYSEFGEL